MHHLFLVCFLESFTNLDGEIERLVQLKGTLLDLGAEFGAVHERDGHEGTAFCLSNVVNGCDVGVVKEGSRLSFAKEASLLVLIAKRIRREELEGDTALEARVLGLVDDAHAAFAGHPGNLVVGDGAADHKTEIVPLPSANAYRP